MPLSSGGISLDLSSQQAFQRTIALRAIAVCSVGAVLYFARAAFEPIALTLLCALVLSGAVEAPDPRPPALLSKHGMIAALDGDRSVG